MKGGAGDYGETPLYALDVIRSGRTEMPFNPADYPDYVPLDQQVSVLRSLGFTVPDQVVETVRSYLEEAYTQPYVEGWPYTWLLTELGMPEYDEDMQITGWKEEVKWAKKFEKATGIKLDAAVTASESGRLPVVIRTLQ